MVEVVIEIEEKEIDEAIEKALEERFNRAFTKTVEFLYAKIFEASPSLDARTGMRYDVKKEDKFKYSGFIGWPDGSEAQLRASWLEFGTGERGSKSFKQFYQEEKPDFMIPIKPRKAMALSWTLKTGERVFAKTTKGQKAKAWIRKAMKEAEPQIQKIWENEFKK